jgi:hypothetical protein
MRVLCRITTGLFNWSKDYVSAATEFEEARKNPLT